MVGSVPFPHANGLPAEAFEKPTENPTRATHKTRRLSSLPAAQHREDFERGRAKNARITVPPADAGSRAELGLDVQHRSGRSGPGARAMFIDARDLPNGSIVTAEICVVGSGPAGITVASEMARAGHDVVILEGGGKRADRSAQELYRGEVLDEVRHGALDKYRQRRFGGTSTGWGGRSAPFDPIDFQQGDYVPDNGWPIGTTDLARYYLRAP